MLPNALMKRIYLLITSSLTIVLIVFGWFNFEVKKDLIIKEKRETLISLTNMLEQRLPSSYDEILRQEGADKLDAGTKARVLSRRLQPVIEEIAQAYPKYGLGYSMYRQRLAFYPFSEAAFNKQTTDSAMKVYDSGKTEFLDNSVAAVWDGKATLSVNYPLYYNGVLIGHAWANTKIDGVNREIMIVLFKNILIVVGFWTLLMLLLRKVFRQIENGLAEFSRQLIEQRADNTKLKAFPELKMVLDAVTDLRKDLVLEKDRLASIIESTKDGMILLDHNLKCLYSNQRMASFGYGRIRAHCSIIETMPELKGSAWYAALCRTMQLNVPQELKEVESIGQDRWFHCVFTPCNGGALVVFHDITGEKVNEGLRSEMGKLECLKAVGEIASSFAHELRNPTSVVKGFLELLKKRNGDSRGYHQLMIDELDRMNQIIEDFLSLARVRFNETKQMSLQQVITEMEPLLQADALKNDIDLRIEMPAEQIAIAINPRKIKQVILNLARNAIEAMTPKGVLSIKVIQNLRQVALIVQDTGNGIPQEVLRHIFDPFFTSKKNGTGLGLSVCKDIVEGHNGSIEVTSETGKGTTVTVFFPIIKDTETTGKIA